MEQSEQQKRCNTAIAHDLCDGFCNICFTKYSQHDYENYLQNLKIGEI